MIAIRNQNLPVSNYKLTRKLARG